MKAHIEWFDIGETHLFLLAKGSLLNLAGGDVPLGVDLFDHYTAVMLLGIAVLLMEPIPGLVTGQVGQDTHVVCVNRRQVLEMPRRIR